MIDRVYANLERSKAYDISPIFFYINNIYNKQLYS
jgi:hypothetical protein